MTIPNSDDAPTFTETGVITGPALERRAQLGRRAQLLAGASVAYNVFEAVIAVTAGVVAGSVALVGFGLDSVVEVSSGLVILWQFRHPLPETRERQALRLMALSFFALAAYVTVESIRSLWTGHDRGTLTGRHRPRRSVPRHHAVSVLGPAPHRPPARVRDRGCGLHPDPLVHLPVRGAAGRAGSERDPRLVLGRPGRRPRHRRRRG